MFPQIVDMNLCPKSAKPKFWVLRGTLVVTLFLPGLSLLVHLLFELVDLVPLLFPVVLLVKPVGLAVFVRAICPTALCSARRWCRGPAFRNWWVC
jgi:hypothetical protein